MCRYLSFYETKNENQGTNVEFSKILFMNETERKMKLQEVKSIKSNLEYEITRQRTSFSRSFQIEFLFLNEKRVNKSKVENATNIKATRKFTGTIIPLSIDGELESSKDASFSSRFISD